MNQQNSVSEQSSASSFMQWIYEFKRFLTPSALVLFLLGFSAGLPFLLISGTLSAWLKESGLEYRSIGFFAWVGLAFSIKFFWAPFVDRLRFPLLWRLGQRRSWLIASQCGIAVGLFCMASLDPGVDTAHVAFIAVLIAFCAATQDVSVDAYRIQGCAQDMQGVVTSAYIAGYRVALLVAGAGALFIAEGFSWQMSYQVMACLMGVGIFTVLLMKEPDAGDRDAKNKADVEAAMTWCSRRFQGVPQGLQRSLAWGWVNVVEPFTEMVSRLGRWIFLLLAVVLFYRVSDIAMGNMANPFYLALGYTKSDIAWVTKIFGLLMVLLGSAFGGVLVARKGLYTSMLSCLFAVIATNLLFAVLAVSGVECLASDGGACVSPGLVWLGLVISADNLAAGASNVVFIAFLSNQVNVEFSATQYALMSSCMTLLGKFISGFSGIVVDGFGFPVFFVYVSCLGIPSILFVSALQYCYPKSFQGHQAASEQSE